MASRLLTAAFIAATWVATAPIVDAQLSDRDRAVHVLNRFGLGATSEAVDAVVAQGVDAWFAAQLADEVAPDPMLDARLAKLPALALDNLKTLNRYNRSVPPKATREERRKIERDRRVPREHLREGVMLNAIYAPNRIREAAADFFRQHFNVSARKAPQMYYVATYERDVIRGLALDYFGNMLRESAKHPAMLYYLDNALSRRPPTKHDLKVVARQVRQKTKSKRRARESVEIAKQRGLNENYARELLELHTLGVDNQYKQRDVVNVAKALTGWTVRVDRKKYVGFTFREDMHIEGPKTVLTTKFPAYKKDAVRQGEGILVMLARHPGTARFVAWKLCRHFVHDEPTDDMVERIAEVYRRTDGHLPEIYRAIYDDPEFFAARSVGSKFKRPFEFVVSAVRVVGADVTSTAGLRGSLREMSEPLYECEDPTGYYDQAEAWSDPGVMSYRWRFAIRLARNQVKGVKLPQDFFDRHLSEAESPAGWKRAMVAAIVPGGVGARTSSALDEVIAAHLKKHKKPKRVELGRLLLALLLGSPEFQRQ